MTTKEMVEYAESCVSQAEALDGFPGTSGMIRLGNMVITLAKDIERYKDRALKQTGKITFLINEREDARNQRDKAEETIERVRTMIESGTPIPPGSRTRLLDALKDKEKP